MVDTIGEAWGSVGVPLLPSLLRQRWRSEALPDWMCSDLRLPIGATFAALDGRTSGFPKVVPGRVLNALAALFRSRIGEIVGMAITDPSLRQDEISISGAQLSTRSENALGRANLLGRATQLSQLAFRDLLEIPSLGAKSALEIACVLEARMVSRNEELEHLSKPLFEESHVTIHEQLLRYLDRPWAQSISERDPRFSAALPHDDDGTIAERIDRLISEPDAVGALTKARMLVSSLGRIERLVSESAGLGLDNALRELLAASSQKRKRQYEALVLRFGWDGRPPRTLEEAGKPLGITRERVRQIESRFLREMPSDLYLPQLDAAIDLLERESPLTIEAASLLLTSSGICKGRFSPETLVATAAMFRRETDLRIDNSEKSGPMILGSHSSIRDVSVAARKLGGRTGVASIHQVANALDRDAEETKRILEAQKNIEFLNSDWFWVTDLPIRRNRLSNIAKKTLCVAAPQSVQSIREAVRRAFTYRSSSKPVFAGMATPPSEVLREFFKHSPEFKVNEGFVSLTSPLKYQDELGEVDRALVEIFRSTSTGVLDRRAVLEAAVARGLNENSISLFLTYSPIIEHVGTDIWKLRGVQVDPSAVEALREANSSESFEKRVLNFGWSSDGRLCIASRLPYSVSGFVVGVPGSIKRYLASSRFEATERESNIPCGTVSINEEGSSFGYQPFLRVSGAEPGDVMLAEFDLSKGTVTLSIAGEAALENESY